MTLEHILQESDNDHIRELSLCITKEDLCLVTDMKGEDDLIVCKLNHDKVISWLKKKVNFFVVQIDAKIGAKCVLRE